MSVPKVRCSGPVACCLGVVLLAGARPPLCRAQAGTEAMRLLGTWSNRPRMCVRSASMTSAAIVLSGSALAPWNSVLGGTSKEMKVRTSIARSTFPGHPGLSPGLFVWAPCQSSKTSLAWAPCQSFLAGLCVNPFWLGSIFKSAFTHTRILIRLSNGTVDRREPFVQGPCALSAF